jgi:TP901 family phage tail tape measure protein
MAATGAIRAGSAFVELFTDRTKLDKGLDAASKRLKSWGNSLVGIGSKIFAFGAALDAAGDASVMAFSNMAFSAGQMALRTGTAVESISTLALVSERAGGSAEGLEHSFLHMSRTLASAAGGSREATEALMNLGLSAGNLVNLAPDEAFRRIATSIAGIKNPMEQAARAQKIFGRGILDQLPLLKMGGAGIAELQDHFAKMGLGISSADVATAREFQGMMKEFEAVLKRVGFEIGRALLPALSQLRGKVQPFVEDVVKWIRENQGLVASMGHAGAIIAGTGAALIGLGVALKIAGGALFVFKTALLFLLSTPGLIAATVAGGVYAFLKYTAAGQQALIDLKDTALDAWGGISDALQAGDLNAALDVVLAGLGLSWQQTWGRMSRYFKDTWSDLKLVFVDFVSDFILSSGFMTKAMLVFGSTVDKVLNKIGVLSDEDLVKRLETAEAGIALAGSDEGLKKLRDAVKANALKGHAGEHQANADDFEGDLADAQARLAAANAAARAARERSRRTGEAPGAPGVGDFTAGVKADTAGTFAGLAAGRLGGGTTDSAATVLNTALAVVELRRLVNIAQQGGFSVG